MTLRLVHLFAIALTVAAAAAPAAAPVGAQVVLEPALEGRTIPNPTDIATAGDGSGRLFVTQLRGQIWMARDLPQSAAPAVFLDIRDRVTAGGGEEGLLGLAFHPDFASNGYLYVNYNAGSGPRRTVIARFRVSTQDPDVADPNSEAILLEVSQPYSNHKGGALRFGADGHLYIAFGDGGSQNDPNNSSQNRALLLGKIARIDVDNPQPPLAYGIPADNPYAGNPNGWRQEIWAYGFRNPWRISFDRHTGELWAADVGGGRIEEIDRVTRGANYGWSIAEGTLCLKPPSGCDVTGISMPIWQYGRATGSCITGGFVYRGSKLGPLVGQYIYGDFGSGEVWALDVSQPSAPLNTLLVSTSMDLSTFGEDESGELYVADFATGGLYRLAGTVTHAPASPAAKLARLAQNEPNPFNPRTRIEFELAAPGNVTAAIYDVRGALVRTLLQRPLDAGVHEVHWDGTAEDGAECASGVYHYRVDVDGGHTKARAMVLVR